MNYSLVSIIVPCYNQAEYLSESLQSVLDQDYSYWECIIVNDGSPDDTEAVAKSWIAKDKRFKYLFQENKGIVGARNTGISLSKGVYILPLDADDKISVKYLTHAVQAFKADVDLKVVYCKAEKFGDVCGLWKLRPFSLFNLSRFNMIFCSALYRKKDWVRVGGYDEKMKDGIEDWEFWIAILKNGGKVECLEEVGFFYRIKPNSRTENLNEERILPLYEYMNIKHSDFFVEHYGSVIKMEKEMTAYKIEMSTNLKSEKFVIDLFCKTIFGFSVFGKFK